MAKANKAKARPEKYADKVKISLTPDQALKALAKDANKKVKDKVQPEPDKE